MKTFPEVHGKEKEWPHLLPCWWGELLKAMVILRTSLPLLRPPWVATHPLVSEQWSNKTKYSQCSQTPTEGTLPCVAEHRAARPKGTRSGTGHVLETLHSTGPTTSEAGKPTCSPNTATSSFSEPQKGSGGRGRGAYAPVQKYSLLT